MAKFKIGDKVTLKSSVKNGEEYNGCEITSRLISAFCDSSFGIIVNTILGTPGNYVYIIDINGRCFNIGEDALELYQPSVPKYKVGDKVRIKKREGKYNDYPCNFTSVMIPLEGKICIIDCISEKNLNPCYKKCKFYNGDDNTYYFKEDNHVYTWHSSMFEPVLEDSKLTLTSFEEGDLIQICGIIGQIQEEINKEYYLDFDDITIEQDHFDCCKKLRELVPDFEKIASIYNAVRLEPECFPEFSTIDDLVKFTQAVNNAYDSKNVTTPKKLNENEIRFQKTKASFTRGRVPTGRSICGRQHKITVVIGHLSNQAISC